MKVRTTVVTLAMLATILVPRYADAKFSGARLVNGTEKCATFSLRLDGGAFRHTDVLPGHEAFIKENATSLFFLVYVHQSSICQRNHAGHGLSVVKFDQSAGEHTLSLRLVGGSGKYHLESNY